MGLPAKCLPVSKSTIRWSCTSDSNVIRNQSATALGATWDTSLIEQAGFKILSQEAKLRAASLVLAPTCNIQRVSSLINYWLY